MIELPEGWTVRANPLIGYDYLYKGELKIQHPTDSDAIRFAIQLNHKNHE